MFEPTLGNGTTACVNAWIRTSLVGLDGGRHSAGAESSPYSHEFTPSLFQRKIDKILGPEEGEEASKESTTENSQ